MFAKLPENYLRSIFVAVLADSVSANELSHKIIVIFISTNFSLIPWKVIKLNTVKRQSHYPFLILSEIYFSIAVLS